MEKGVLVISLDFELIWGIFDHSEITDKISYFDNTLKAVPEMVSLFEKNEMSVTWATVGMLFNENWDEWYSNFPSVLPTYNNVNLNPYEYGKKHYKSGLDSYFFAPNLIKDIQSVKGQEMASHTYSHYYCLEKGQTEAQFTADLQQACKIAKTFDVDMKSLVFPRNQFNQDYLQICEDFGFESVRTNPDIWYWDTTSRETLMTKLARTGDAYLPFGKKSYAAEAVLFEKAICKSPASRFLRPQHSSEILNRARLQRIKNEIIQAAKKGEVYHLWWHPHNFGIDTEGALKSLKEIIEVFVHCKEVYGMKSLNMKQFRDACF